MRHFRKISSKLHPKKAYRVVIFDYYHSPQVFQNGRNLEKLNDWAASRMFERDISIFPDLRTAIIYDQKGPAIKKITYNPTGCYMVNEDLIKKEGMVYVTR